VSLAKRRVRHVPQLNLVPMLDMMSLLIQVLLINVHFGAYAQIETQTSSMTGKDPGEEGLRLDVGIDEGGYTVSWSAEGRRLQRSFPCVDPTCAPEQYDRTAVRDLLVTLKSAAPDERRVVLSPKGNVPFEVMASTMDAVRTDGTSPLFPDIVMADRK